ncbi:MAG TPA: tetratricopeptide repeat protein, partial [Candidatus Ozemobacteraceae bacterium]|nr:tetratricopeptide repeat protein [Candidatus Ozemobacteraceae bacterium]
MTLRRLGLLMILCLLWAGAAMPLWAKKAARIATAPAFLTQDQDKLIKNEVITFLRRNSERKPGEGWLFLARQYRELGQLERAADVLRQILRAAPVSEEQKWDAQLLLGQILVERKEYDAALKEFDRLISWMPVRRWRVEAKVERAKLLSRTVTGLPDLFKAFRRYFAPFPEVSDDEEVRYLIGFERGYDLEIAMRALEAWEEIARYPERPVADLACLNLALIYTYDLGKPERAEPFLASMTVPYRSAAASSTLLIRGTVEQFYRQPRNATQAMELYRSYLQGVRDLDGWRVATVLSGRLLAEDLGEPQTAIEVFSSLASPPRHLLATPSLSLQKRQEVAEEDKFWGVLGYKMAGYTAEYLVKDPDRARACYLKAQEIDRTRVGIQADFWVEDALRRTEPKMSQAELHFEQAYEKYRGRDPQEAIRLWESFVASYPEHVLAREACFRIAVATHDDLKQLDRALELYERYLIRVMPQKSVWKLDKIYDWGRIDEVRYRIGSLKANHRKDPLSAIKIFSELSTLYPDSYWAMQGMKDTIRLQRELLGDENSARQTMRDFIDRYPDTVDAQAYRKELAEKLVEQGDVLEAADLLRGFLDHGLPSDEGYLTVEKQWRELSFRAQEKALRELIRTSASADRQMLYEELIDVMGLASSSAPLETLVEELKDSRVSDESRWLLTYQLGTRLYRDYPEKAKTVFQTLADSASGPAQLACVLTLGNLAYRVEKSAVGALHYYERAASLTPPLHPLLETPRYRLGRLYLQQNRGIDGLQALTEFVRQYPRSRHLPQAFSAMGDAYAALHHPVRAKQFWAKAVRLLPSLKEKIEKKVADAAKLADPDAWLKSRVDERQRQREEEQARQASAAAGLATDSVQTDKTTAEDREPTALFLAATGTVKIDPKATAEELYAAYRDEQQRMPKPDPDNSVTLLLAILKKEAPTPVVDKAMRHFISWRVLRQPRPKDFVAESQEILTKRNYPVVLSELLYRLAEAKERQLKDYEGANKTYFEYLSFFPQGGRVLRVRERIPQVYALAKDLKNALRFNEKLINDTQIPADMRVDASLRKARLEETTDEKEEAVKTLEAALSFESKRRPELYLQLERLTSTFEYVQKALDTPGEETFRFEALQRLIRKAEEDQKHDEAARLVREYQKAFTGEEAVAWIAKKGEDLGKRGTIAEIEAKIEGFPEEPETAARLYKLAQLVEGMENTKYRSQDLFYELTLVYPGSPFYRESKLRAENVRVIKSIDQIGGLLKKGVKTGEGDALLLHRARLYRDTLQDTARAREDYEALLKLFPDSPRLDEAYLGLGSLILKVDRDGEKAREYWEKGLGVSRNPEVRRQLARNIDDLRQFREKILYSEKNTDHAAGTDLVWKRARLENDRDGAQALVQEALRQLENRPQRARLHYLNGRLFEEAERWGEAISEYEAAHACLYHPGCRKDRVLYRLGRLYARTGKMEEAYRRCVALVTRYPRSRFSRSGFYWLYKQDLAAKRFNLAFDRLGRLLQFRNLFPTHRQAITKLQKEVGARMNLADMQRLQALAKTDGGAAFHYYIGRVLENDMGDVDGAMREYETYLRSNPPIARARDLLMKLAQLAES